MTSITLFILWAPLALAQTVGLEDILEPLDPETSSLATGVSADGSVVVGWIERNSVAMAYRWTEAGGLRELGVLPGGRGSFATAVSADGAVVVGWSQVQEHTESFRWTETGGLESLGPFPGAFGDSAARAVSADGSIIVGEGYVSIVTPRGGCLCPEAYRWTRETGFVPLGLLAGGSSSHATGVSADGSVLAGIAETIDELGSQSWEVFLWTEADGLKGLGPFPRNASLFSQIRISGDGKRVAGAVDLGVFLWTEELGFQIFEGLSPYRFSCYGDDCFAFSADGSTIAWGGEPAVLWDSLHGLRYLVDELGNYGATSRGWRLSNMGGLSADGKVLVGTAETPDGRLRTWRIRFEGCRDPQEVPAITGVPEIAVAALSTVDLDGSASTSGPGEAAPVMSYEWRVESGLADVVGLTDEARLRVRGREGGGPVRVSLTVDDGECANPATREVEFQFCSQDRIGLNASFSELCPFPRANEILLSGDGLVLVAVEWFSEISGYHPRSFVWTRTGGLVEIQSAPDRAFFIRARAVSRDGSVVVGEYAPSPCCPPDAFRWTAQEGFSDLGAQLDSRVNTSARGIDAAGKLIVGTLSFPGFDPLEYSPVVWSVDGQYGEIAIGPLSGGFGFSEVTNLSADGSAVFFLASQALIPSYAVSSFRWTETEGARSLGAGPRVSAVSSDGARAVGTAQTARGPEAVLWSEERGIESLVDPTEAFPTSAARGITADGRVVVGSRTDADGAEEATSWSEEVGLRPLRDLFERDHGLDLSGWRLTSAQSVSDDGLTIVGFGQNPGGAEVVWLADLDLCGDPAEVASIEGLPEETVRPGDELTLDGSRSSAGSHDDLPITLAWEIASGPGEILGAHDHSSVRVRAAGVGSISVRLTVDDGRCANSGVAEATIEVAPVPAGNWLLCDSNGDGANDISDPVFTLRRLFLGGPESQCPPSADCNSDGRNDLSDAVFNLRALFGADAAPLAPYPECAVFEGCARACR